MKIKLISIKNDCDGIYKRYNVEYKGKKDVIYYSSDDWGIRFEPYNGNFTEKEFEEIKKHLFEDAYYNMNFSKYE